MKSSLLASPLLKSPSRNGGGGAKSGGGTNVPLLLFLLMIFWMNLRSSMDSHKKWTDETAGSSSSSTDSSSASASSSSGNKNKKYIPSVLEKGIMDVSKSELHYDKDLARECDLYRKKENNKFRKDYHAYVDKLGKFANATRDWKMKDPTIKDLRLLPSTSEERESICQEMDKVLHGSFDAKKDCSLTGSAGFVEPLLPPLRHPRICQKGFRWPLLLNIDYLVHDFGKICREIRPGIRTVFFDLGASLEFHGGNDNPALSLVKLYNRFGIQFDHYYAFEYKVIPPKRVYQKIPAELLPAYHWYNVPVESSPTSKQNPWKAVLSKFTPDDLVVIKLDIDTSFIELPLIHELMEEKYAPLVDHVYFEHHVRMRELHKNWRKSANGTLQDSLDLFTSLREMGIGAHSWV